MILLKRTETLFGLTALLVLGIGQVFYKSTFTLALHDTYFVIAQSHFAIAISIFLLIIALIYYLFTKYHKPLKPILGYIHYSISALSFLILIYLPTYISKPQRYTPGSNPFENTPAIDQLISYLVLFFLLGQIIFLLNIILTLLGRTK